MAGNFPIWQRSVAPQGELPIPSGDHSLLDAFGTALEKGGGFFGKAADWWSEKQISERPDPAGHHAASPSAPAEDVPYHDASNTLASLDARRRQYAAMRALMDLSAASDKQLADLQAQAAPGAPGLVEQSLATFDKLRDQVIADASPAMRPYLRTQVALLRDEHIAQATRIEVAARHAWDKQTAQDMFHDATAQVTVDPGRFDFVLANLSEAIKARDLPADERQQLLDQMKDHLGYVAMTSIIDRNPDRAAQMIESGAVDKYMAADEKEEWLQKIADREDEQRRDEVEMWTRAENAAPGLHLALRDAGKRELLQELQRGTLGQEAIDQWKDVLGPELLSDFTKMVGCQANATSDTAVVGDLLMAAGERDLWREAADAMQQGRLSTADFAKIVAINWKLLQQ
jgi:hypothetical protein